MCKTVDLSQTGLAQLLKLALYQPEAAIHPQKTNLILDVHLKNYQHFGPINALIINDYQIIATPKYTKSWGSYLKEPVYPKIKDELALWPMFGEK